MSKPLALIVGVGDGLSASLARLFFDQGYRITLAARDIDKIESLAKQTEATRHRCDASDPTEVKSLFSDLDGPLRVVVYNPSARQRAPLIDLDAEAVRTAIHVTAYGAFLVGQEAARRMLEQDIEDGARGTILFTGASAGVKGFPQSAPFAMGKFAHRRRRVGVDNTWIRWQWFLAGKAAEIDCAVRARKEFGRITYTLITLDVGEQRLGGNGFGRTEDDAVAL